MAFKQARGGTVNLAEQSIVCPPGTGFGSRILGNSPPVSVWSPPLLNYKGVAVLDWGCIWKGEPFLVLASIYPSS